MLIIEKGNNVSIYRVSIFRFWWKVWGWLYGDTARKCSQKKLPFYNGVQVMILESKASSVGLTGKAISDLKRQFVFPRGSVKYDILRLKSLSVSIMWVGMQEGWTAWFRMGDLEILFYEVVCSRELWAFVLFALDISPFTSLRSKRSVKRRWDHFIKLCFGLRVHLIFWNMKIL